MTEIFGKLDRKKEKDIQVLSDFVSIFCREKHLQAAKTTFPIMDEGLQRAFQGKDLVLCSQCTRLLNHGIVKLLLCPHDPKPMCKKCHTHCYAAGYREKVREIMRFSGLYLVKRGRVDLLAHYLF